MYQQFSKMQQSKYNNNDNVKVVVRVRPPLEREITSDIFISTVQVLKDKKRIQLFQYIDLHKVEGYEIDLDEYIQNPNNYRKHQFTFDHVYDDESSQKQVYAETASYSVQSALKGYNATIFAYGQTGTGKTFTMQGFRYNLHDDQRGIIPRAAQDIFSYIRDYKNNQITYMVRVSYIQIYNEVLTDLLRQQKQKLAIREDAKRGIFIEGVSAFAVRSPQQMIQLIKKGARSRATAKTNMNELSSRSHAVFIITIQQIYHNDNGENQGKTCKVAKLNIVDLAGSQRVNVSGAMGDRLKECQSINKSLHTLGLVIKNLTETKNPSYIPYRNSSLTRLLSDSLGGNCKTTMFTMISPSPDAFSQSISTLNFAYSAKSIKNKPIINQDFDQKALIRKYQNELQKLRTELTQKNKVIIDKAKLLELQEEKKRIQEDKNNVEKALQQRSKEFFKERQEKKRLQQKIKAFNSQLIYSGHQSQYEKALHDQKKIIHEYEKKIKNLEAGKKESNQGYDSELFDKQNLILMSLAAKLNERDEVNMHLNEQLCACQRIHEDDEKEIQAKNKRIEQLKNVLRQHKIQIPQEQKNMLMNEKQEKEQKIDGVCVGGQITYNVTNKNLKQAEQQIFNLKERNQEQKQEIFRLKQQLSKKDSHKKPVQKQEVEGYKKIKESINIITRGLQKKENIDMKQIVSEIFKIKKEVEKRQDEE